MPTKNRPASRRAGPISVQISRSAALSSVAWGAPPTARLLRNSPSLGTRLIAPRASPSTSKMRLSPALTPGRKACTITGSCCWLVTSSSRALRPGALALLRTTPWPARPPRGLSTTSAWLAAKAASWSVLLLTSEGAIRWLKRKAPIFSFQALSDAGRFSTRTPARSPRSSRWVA